MFLKKEDIEDQEAKPSPPLGGILGTYIVLKHSLRVFQIRLFALLK